VGVVASVGGPIVLILGALISGSEYGWTTFKTVLTQGPRRLDILGGKAAALAVFVTAFVALGWTATAAGSLVLSTVEGMPIDLPSLSNLLGGLGAGWLIAMVWGMAGLALGLIFRSTSAPIGVGLIWGLAVENIIVGLGGSVGIFKTVQDYLVGPNASTLANAVRPSFFTEDVAVISTTHAILVLVSYIAVLAATAACFFRTRDLT